ncbi:hypothetical protein BKA80DRAFT_252642 [Phyllosticta citrichinensis]
MSKGPESKSRGGSAYTDAPGSKVHTQTGRRMRAATGDGRAPNGLGRAEQTHEPNAQIHGRPVPFRRRCRAIERVLRPSQEALMPFVLHWMRQRGQLVGHKALEVEGEKVCMECCLPGRAKGKGLHHFTRPRRNRCAVSSVAVFGGRWSVVQQRAGLPPPSSFDASTWAIQVPLAW